MSVAGCGFLLGLPDESPPQESAADGGLESSSPAESDSAPGDSSDAGSAPISLIVGSRSSRFCALRTDGFVFCWGNNTSGAAGDPSGAPIVEQPVRVQRADGTFLKATDLALSDDHACAIGDDSRVYCWGSDADCELGRGPAPCSKTPFPRAAAVQGAGGGDLVGIRSVLASSTYSCALATDGTVSCWGSANAYSVGGSDYEVRAPAARAMAKPGFTQLATTGFGSNCMISDAGEVDCWGRAKQGITGVDPDTAEQCDIDLDPAPCTAIPHPISGLETMVSHVSLDDFSGCAIRAGRLLCWGYWSCGALGRTISPCDDDAGDAAYFYGASPSTSFPGVISSVAIEQGAICAVSADKGGVVCLDDDGPWSAASDDAGRIANVDGSLLESVSQVAIGGSAVCALTGEGRVLCWASPNDPGEGWSALDRFPKEVVFGN